MRLGFIFNMIEADITLREAANPDLNPDDVTFSGDSGELEKLAAKLDVDFLSLNFDYFAFALKREFPPAILLGVEDTGPDGYLYQEQEIIKKLSDGLGQHGLFTGNVYLLADPQWTRHGEPITYEDFSLED